MPEAKLVSVVTPTWNRPTDLFDTLHHVREQDYPNVEHVIVSDGVSPENAHACGTTCKPYPYIGQEGLNVKYRYYELGRNTSGEWPESFGVAPLTVGYLLARGDYIMPWCDDERALTPLHISLLVAGLEAQGVDFVYPSVRIWRNGDPDGPETAIIGAYPPRPGQITHFLFKRELLRVAWPKLRGHPCDWTLVDDWMRAGATYAWLHECTFTHRLDQ